jgi:hypothetical protein
VITISFKQTINYLKLITCLTPNPHKCWVWGEATGRKPGPRSNVTYQVTALFLRNVSNHLQDCMVT